MVRQCSKCKQSKPITEFNRDNRTHAGWQYKCKVCKSAYNRANREHNSKRHNAYMQVSRARIDGRTNTLFLAARNRAKRTSKQFTICKEHVQFLLILGVCAKSGIKFDMQPRQNTRYTPFGPSLDRIDNTRGYEPDNIQLVCNMFNIGKGEHRETDFIAMCMLVAKKNANHHAAIVRLAELEA